MHGQEEENAWEIGETMHGRQEGCVETIGEEGCMADKRDVLRQRERGMHGRQEGCAETREAKRKGMHEE